MSYLQPFVGLFRRFRTFVLRREVEVTGRCRGCGSCCRHILLKDRGRWLRTAGQYNRLVEYAPDHARFEHTGRDDLGFMTFTCRMLGADNNCTSYETRPPLCSNYPTKSLYYHGGWLRDDCGYSFKAVTFRDVIMGRRRVRAASFSKALERELEQEKTRR